MTHEHVYRIARNKQSWVSELALLTSVTYMHGQVVCLCVHKREREGEIDPSRPQSLTLQECLINLLCAVKSLLKASITQKQKLCVCVSCCVLWKFFFLKGFRDRDKQIGIEMTQRDSQVMTCRFEKVIRSSYLITFSLHTDTHTHAERTHPCLFCFNKV